MEGPQIGGSHDETKQRILEANPMTERNEEQDRPELDLSPAKQRAIEARLGGGDWKEAAEAAGVSRQTLWRWRKEHPDFQAALNRQKEELRDAIFQDLQQAAVASAAAVRLSASEGDGHLGLQLLRAMDLLGPKPLAAGPIDPEVIEERQKRKAEWDAVREMMETMEKRLAAELGRRRERGGAATPPNLPDNARPDRPSLDAGDGEDDREPAEDSEGDAG